MSELANTHRAVAVADPLEIPDGRSAVADRRRRPAAVVPLPRSDLGTVLLHWGTAIAMTASLATGLPISADAPESVFARSMLSILPDGEIWTVHFIAGLSLFFCASAYVAYLLRSGLRNRISLKRLVALFVPGAASKPRWRVVNVALHWVLYLMIVVMAVTGVLLYVGYGGWVVTVHAACAIGTIGYVLAHLIGHLGYGGWRQLVRVFLPAKLVPNRTTKPYPLLLGAVVAVPVTAALAGLDFGTRDTLVIGAVGAGPTLDGVLDDEVWRRARPVRVRTMQGVNLGGSGESTVEMRAVHDGRKVFFAFRWEDPSRSLRRLPMIKTEEGWKLLGTKPDVADVNDFYEDKFAALFSRTDSFGNGGSTHMGAKPIDGRPAALHGRGLHYTMDGSTLDVWQWKASRGGHLGYMDDQYFGPPRDATPAEAAGKARYQGGYWNDPGRAFYSYSYKIEVGHRGGVVTPARLPKDVAATTAALGRFDFNPDSSDEEGARWWMTEAETVPYSPELDAKIPVGTVLPTVLITGNYEGDRANILASAKWKDGRWTLEASRDLKTGSAYDLDFVPDQDMFLWVSVFDHNQTRHTRHMRPVVIHLR